LRRAFYACCERFESRIVHYSVQRNHIHIVVETAGPRSLGRAMQALAIRMAKGLNGLMQRKGRVFADRYHSRSLKTPTEVRDAIVYVYRNAQKHLREYGHTFSEGWVDEFSSAAWFDGWAVRPEPGDDPSPPPVARARTWILETGWMRAGGRIRSDEWPRS